MGPGLEVIQSSSRLGQLKAVVLFVEGSKICGREIASTSNSCVCALRGEMGKGSFVSLSSVGISREAQL